MTKRCLSALMFCSVVLFIGCKKKGAVATDEPVLPKEEGSVLLFNGDAYLGSSAVWKEINLEQNGTVSTAKDETDVLCWKFLKPAGSHRAEGHGVKGYQANEGADIYIGWTSKLSMPVALKTDAVFQWKSYPTIGSLQNHPIMVRTRSSKLEVELFDSDHVATVPWSTPLQVNTWIKLVLRIKVSRSASQGFIEFWYNGVKQTFSNGTQRVYCRTLDSDYCDPKWGVYGGDESEVTHLVKNIRIASGYSKAAQ
jgi:hypothetical protein